MMNRRMPGVITGALLLLAATAHAANPQLNIGSGNVAPGGQVPITVTVGTTGAPVGGADFILKPDSGVTITSCDLTAIKAAGQDASYLDPADCTAGCAQVEVVIFSISDVKAIADGGTLVTCQLQTTAAGDFAVTALPPPGASVVQLNDLAAEPYPAPQVNNGSIHVAVPQGTSTNTATITKTPTITQTPKVSNTPKDTATITNTPTITNTRTVTNTPSPTNTPIFATLVGQLLQGDTSGNVVVSDASHFPPSGVVKIGDELLTYAGKSGNTLTGAARGAYGTQAATHAAGAVVTVTTAPESPGGGEDDEGCSIVAPAQRHAGWMLLIPAAILLWARRRAR